MENYLYRKFFSETNRALTTIDLIESIGHKEKFWHGVCLESAYFVETKNFLLKVL